MSEKIYSPQYDLEVDAQVLAQQEKLNEELGLYVPAEESENADIWQSFYSTIRELYKKSYFTKDQTDEVVQHFYGLDNETRQGLIDRLLEFERQHDVETELVEVMATQYDMREELNEIAALLPEHLQEEFKHYVTKGEEMPTDLKRQAEFVTAGNTEHEDRLQKLLTSRVNLEEPVSKGSGIARTLSPADLRAKFNVAPRDVIVPDEEEK